jgi:hypothetical protein
MDLRKPSGYFFCIMGGLVSMMGVLAPGARAPLSDSNVNLACGVCMLAFGALLLLLTRISPET